MDRRKFLKTLPALPYFFNPSFEFTTPSLDGLEVKLRTLQWIAFSPTMYNPEASKWPSINSLTADLETLAEAGIQGIFTYGLNNGLKPIPSIARQVGMEGVIAGIWDIDRQCAAGTQEWNNALSVKDSVDGYCVGNEGLGSRYSLNQIRDYIKNLKNATGKPVTTTEQVEDYNDAELTALGDWVFPIVHPYFNGFKTLPQAVTWSVDRFNWLNSISGGRVVIIKETGFPTAGDYAVGKDLQYDFYKNLTLTGIKFSFFEAFDQPWKSWADVEKSWGLWDQNRNPKKAVEIISARASDTRNWTDYE